MKSVSVIFVLAMLSIAGCAKSQSARSSSDETTHPSSAAAHGLPPILYHRTGGIAGTDDRVVIWPDGLIDVTGRLLPSATSRLPKARLAELVSMFDGWSKLQDEYPANAADAYVITISFGDKSVIASDLAANLPETFRRIFTEIEAIAAQAESDPRSWTP